VPNREMESDHSRRLVFDAKAWREAGYDQPDGNEQFWKPATIISTSRSDHDEEVATVRFDHDGRLSRGHFTGSMRSVAREALNGGEDRG
jgi:hypothetical protein